MDIEKQVEYWTGGSAEDFAAAESLLEKGHTRHSLFFAHLAIEKMLKALVARQSRNVPPRIHGLMRLAVLARLRLDSRRQDFLREFGAYQIEGRYPDAQELALSPEVGREELVKAEEMLAWLKRQL